MRCSAVAGICFMKSYTVFVLALGMLGSTARAQMAGNPSFRAILVKGEQGVDIIRHEGQRYPVRSRHAIPPDALDKEYQVFGRFVSDRESGAEIFVIERASQPVQDPSPVFTPLRPRLVAPTERTLPLDQLKPGADIELTLPELGYSTSSRGTQPIQMRFLLPGNYRRETAHPVIVHFAGGRGNAGGVTRWRRVVGPDHFILIGADYDHQENLDRGILQYNTCRDHESRIGRHALQILGNTTAFDTNTVILAGVSSGAYNITDNLRGHPRGWEPFAGFCAIAGGSGTGSPRLGERSVLFLMGAGDESRHGWLMEGVDQLKQARTKNLTVHIVPGVGHAWAPEMDPLIQEWLKTDFPLLARLERWRALLHSDLSNEAKEVVRSWMRHSGLE